VPGRRLDHHRPVAEYVEVFVVQQFGFRILQRAVLCWLNDALRLVREHEVTLGFLNNPRRGGEGVGVGRVIRVVVRHREVGDVRRLIAGRGELWQQGLGGGHDAFAHRCAVALEVTVFNRAGIEHERPLWVDDEVGRVGEVHLLEFVAREVEQLGVETANRSVLEDVKPNAFDRRGTLLRCSQRQHGQCERRDRERQSSNHHR
jgi:hypothetical protein